MATPKQTVKLNMPAIRARMAEGQREHEEKMAAEGKRTRKTLGTKRLHDRAITILKKVILPQLREGKRDLHLWDEWVAEKIGCTPDEVDTAKRYLSKLEIIFVPNRWAHRTGPGQRCHWQLRLEYFTDTNRKERKPSKVMKNYTKEFREEFGQLYREIKEDLQNEAAFYKKTAKERKADFMIFAHMKMNELLAGRGKTRSDYRVVLA